MNPFVLQLLGGVLLLYAGGEGMVRGSAALGLRLGMTPLLTGMTIVALGTSAPELVVSLQAALDGEGSMAVGNVVGSNIANMALILGLATLIRPIRVEARLVRHDVPIMLATTALMIFMLWDGMLSRTEAGVLLASLAVFVVYTVFDSRSPRRAVKAEFKRAVPDGDRPWPLILLVILAAAIGLLGGGKLFVDGAIGLSRQLDIAPAVIGLSVAAIGTSLPELATSVVAAVRGYGDMAAGNVVGSNVFNTLTVLGVTGSVIPLERGAVSTVDLTVLAFVSLLSLRLLATRATMERWEGGALLIGFVAYMGWLFL